MNSSTFGAPLRLSATLLLVGQVLYIVFTLCHTGGDANDHPAIFAAYAGGESWTAVHVGQFAAMAILLAGLLALLFVLEGQAGAVNWAGRFGAAAAVAALALYGALQAVDGVANKQADLAWVSAPEAEKAARFASAEAIRWVEWGDAELPRLRAGPGVAPVRDRGRADSLGSASRGVPDGAYRSHLSGAGLGRRRRGLLTNGVERHRAGLGSGPGVDGLAGHRRLAE